MEAGGILDLLPGPCDPSESFPMYCNPDLPGRVEYPYCVFTSDGQWNENNSGTASTTTSSTTTATSTTTRQQSDPLVVCAKNGDEVSVPTAQGTIVSCTCLYLTPYLGAVSSCPDLVVTVPLALTISLPPPPTDNDNGTNHKINWTTVTPMPGAMKQALVRQQQQSAQPPNQSQPSSQYNNNNNYYTGGHASSHDSRLRARLRNLVEYWDQSLLFQGAVTESNAIFQCGR